jgi:hypothetical protein
MALLEKHLRIKRSLLPGAGKGLFTTKFIPKGTRIVEYKEKLQAGKTPITRMVETDTYTT